MAQTTAPLAAIVALGLLLGAGFALAGPFGEDVDDEATATASSEEATPQTRAADGGEMTLEEHEATHEGVEPAAPPFYASRVVTLEGRLTLEALPVLLSNVNGEIEVTRGEEDDWSLVANLTAWASTPEQARQERDEMTFEWDAGEPGNRSLQARVEHANEDNDSGPLFADEGRKESHLRLAVPEDALLALTAMSTNADVHVSGIEASRLSAHTTNGKVLLDELDARQLDVETTNGAIDADVEGIRSASLGSTNGEIVARLVPTATGSITVGTTNADVDVSVPETPDRGYHVSASTTNGEATIALEDGEPERSEDGSQASFRTDGLQSRSIQSSVQLSSTNGDVAIGPT